MAISKPFNNKGDKNRIYHYCKLRTAIDYILPTLKLRISPLINTNDPRENKSFIFSGAAGPGIEIGNIMDRNEEISKILRNDCKVLCFCEDIPYNMFGYELSRMWALYGDNHEGVCLELDREVFAEENKIDPMLFKNIQYFQFDINKQFNYKLVDYNAMHTHGPEKYLKDVFRHTHLDFLYFTKNKEWDSEYEIRLMHFSTNPTDEFCSIKNSIKNIFVGVSFQEKNLDSLIKACPQVDISKLEFLDARMRPKEIYKGVTS